MSVLLALSVGILILFLAFTFVSITLVDWNFSTRYASGVSDELVARAVIQQFLSDDKRLRRTEFYTPPAQPRPVDWLARYRNNPVFPDGGAQFPQKPTLTFDPNRPYYSTDNSLGATPVAGWLDRSQNTQSIPPHCVNLIINLPKAHYSALLQSIWPYALTSAGPIRIGGGLVHPGLPQSLSSQVNGSVLLLPESLAPCIPVPLDGDLQHNDVMAVSDFMFDSMRATSTLDSTPLRLGFSYPEADLGGNVMTGSVDSADGEPVTLTPSLSPNAWQGRTHPGHGDLRQRQTLGRLFTYPPAPSGCDLPGVTLISSPPNRYLLNDDLILTGAPDQDVTYQVDGDLTNIDLEGNSSHAKLSLKDCRLYINGNLDLGEGGLQGDNATLIVNGHIVVRDGNMEAADKGLVILCNRLGVSAVGSYRGLILVRDCAAFTKMNVSDPQHHDYFNPLEIRGAIICGGSSAKLRLASQPESNLSTTVIRGISIASARFTYDPRYLTSLQPISPYQLIHLEKVQ
jgi:hypothetical protein